MASGRDRALSPAWPQATNWGVGVRMYQALLAGRNTPMYVHLTRGEDGFHRAVAAHLAPVPVPAGDVLIRGRAINGMNCGKSGPEFCPNVGIRYGIEKYFVPEGEGREIESARNQGKVTIVAAVTPDGRAAIKRLLLDGKPLYDEPLY